MSGWLVRLLALALVACGLPSRLHAQRDMGPAAPGSALTVYLLTIGTGQQIWERFGHNAIIIRDATTGSSVAWDWGRFSFEQAHFFWNFARGTMWYSMGSNNADAVVAWYAKANREISVQELNLTPPQRAALLDSLRVNDTDDRRNYHYDYYLDNCSTRIRDALDQIIGGRIRRRLEPRLTTTYRNETKRLNEHNVGFYLGLILLLGPATDRPISAYQESFLPGALSKYLRDVTVSRPGGEDQPFILSEQTLRSSNAYPVPPTPTDRRAGLILVGSLMGVGVLALGLAARTRRWARRFFQAIATAWMLLAGAAGVVLTWLWAASTHAVAYNNENLFQANLLALALAFLLRGAFSAQPSRQRRALLLAYAVAAVSVLGVLVKAFPPFHQANAEIIALALPLNVAVATGLWAFTRSAPNRT